MTAALILVPGLTSPHHDFYKPLYASLAQEADNRRMACEIVCFPGQIDGHGTRSGILSTSSAVEHLQSVLTQPGDGDPREVHLLAFSFGCAVALQTLMDTDCNVKEAIMWGPIPFWRNWLGFRKREAREHLGVGTHIADDDVFFDEMIPFELLAARSPARLILGSGSEDPYCGKAFLQYLVTLPGLEESQRHEVKTLKNSGHTPSPNDSTWKDFVDLVFSNIHKDLS